MILEILPDGNVRSLYSDKIDLSKLGRQTIRRASHVEFNNTTKLWGVRSAKTMKLLFATQGREEALELEEEYYNPEGRGWKELVENRIDTK